VLFLLGGATVPVMNFLTLCTGMTGTFLRLRDYWLPSIGDYSGRPFFCENFPSHLVKKTQNFIKYKTK